MEKNRKHRSFWSSRWFQTIVCIISFVVMMNDILAMLLFSVYIDKGPINTVTDLVSMVTMARYEDSELFCTALANEAQDIVEYRQAELLFGENMEDLENAVYHQEIDLAYADYIRNGTKLTGITYRLEDLIQWGTVETFFMTESQFIELRDYKAEDPYMTYTDWLTESSGNRNFSCIVNESSLTCDGKSLYYYAENPYRMEYYSKELKNTIEYVQELYAYAGLGNLQTNLKAALVSPFHGFIFNDFESLIDLEGSSDRKIQREIESYLMNSGCYVIYNGIENHFLSNTFIESYEITDRISFSNGGSLYLWVDTAYPEDDLLSQNRQVYYKMVKGYRLLLSVFVVSFLLFWVSLIRRTMLEGRNEQKQRAVSRWKNPLILAAALGIAAALVYITYGTFYLIYEYTYEYGYGNEIGTTACYMLAAGVIYAGCFMVSLLYFYLEMVRRLKEKTLYQKSVVRIILREVKRLFETMKKLVIMANGRVRFVVGYLLFLFVNLFVVLLSINSGIGFLVLMTFADLAIGAVILYYFHEQDMLRDQMKLIAEGNEREKLDTTKYHLSNRLTADKINEMDQGIRRAVEISLQDERMKTELITNVSHDIKTPLTSIITYVDLLKKEPLETENEKQYVEVLEQKSERLKQLIDDLIEASKINSGNIAVVPVRLSMGELLPQVYAEYESKLLDKKLAFINRLPEEALYFTGDSRHVWRVLSNLFGNICKYAMPGTRVYMEAAKSIDDHKVILEMKNVSQESLNISPQELTERFVRGDASRNTEGNGLGLSIAKSLMQAMGGEMELSIDGDLFKVKLIFLEAK